MNHAFMCIGMVTQVPIIVLYVDDILIVGSNRAGLESIKKELKSRFNMKDRVHFKEFLGIQVVRYRAKRTLHLSQAYYTE